LVLKGFFLKNLERLTPPRMAIQSLIPKIIHVQTSYAYICTVVSIAAWYTQAAVLILQWFSQIPL
jgi:hypothetical protein